MEVHIAKFAEPGPKQMAALKKLSIKMAIIFKFCLHIWRTFGVIYLKPTSLRQYIIIIVSLISNYNYFLLGHIDAIVCSLKL